MLVDSRGNPLTADVVGPMLGPVRFEEQPKWVRRMGRKQMAGRTKSQRHRKKAWWAKNAGRSYDLPRWATKSAERRRARRAKSGRRGTSRRRRRVSAWSQPSWTRRGRKARRGASYRTRRSAYRAASRRTRRYAGGRRRTRGLTRKEVRRQNRATWRARKSTRRSRKASRSSSKRGRRGAARRTRRASFGQIMSRLRGTRSKAWVCAGPRRTGCGGGRKGRRGSRVIGILRG